MLVVTRKPGESLVIGHNVTVKILSVSGDKITVGIDAPRDVTILRSELSETIAANKESAQQLSEAGYKNMAALFKNK